MSEARAKLEAAILRGADKEEFRALRDAYVAQLIAERAECPHCGGPKGHPPFDLCSPAKESE
jgi:hypothetical protein